jgi:hypothetical protein
MPVTVMPLSMLARLNWPSLNWLQIIEEEAAEDEEAAVLEHSRDVTSASGQATDDVTESGNSENTAL